MYEYKGLNKKGRNVSGLVDADSPQAARRKLRELKLMPTDLTETREALASPKKEIQLGRIFKGGLRAELPLTTRQLSVLLEACRPVSSEGSS